MNKFVEFLSYLLAVDTPDVTAPDERHPLPSTAGARSYVEDNVIVINPELNRDGLQYIALAHEMRHIYQYQVVQNNLTELESKATIREWRRGFKNYRDSTSGHYEDQILEIDATAFTYYLMRVLFNREILVQGNARNILKRAELISRLLPVDEIRRIYREFYGEKGLDLT